jgi:hypothetical protein
MLLCSFLAPVLLLYVYIIAKWVFLVNLFAGTKLVSTNLLFLVLKLTLEPIFVLAEVFLLGVR